MIWGWEKWVWVQGNSHVSIKRKNFKYHMWFLQQILISSKPMTCYITGLRLSELSNGEVKSGDYFNCHWFWNEILNLFWNNWYFIIWSMWLISFLLKIIGYIDIIENLEKRTSKKYFISITTVVLVFLPTFSYEF